MLDYMANQGEVSRVARVMIDFSGEDRQRTVTLRVDNGQQKLVTKTGKLTDGVRSEAPLALSQEQPFETSLSAMNILGYDRAKVCLRRLYVAAVGPLEYSVRDVLRASDLTYMSTLLEIEARNVHEDEVAQAQANVQNAFAFHDLTPMTAAEWESWVSKTHANADMTFTYSPENATKLADNLVGWL